MNRIRNRSMIKSRSRGWGILLLVVLLPVFCFSASRDSVPDSTYVKPFRFVPFPIVGYDSDMGFQYGALAQFFFYGDGKSFPEYKHMLYLEFARFTKGSGVNQFFYDSKYLLPWNLRITTDVTYLTEKALDFYGFNGYQAAYYPEFEDDQSDEYISRVYYRHERKLLRIFLDLQGPIVGQKLRWLGGINLFDIEVATVDIDNINKGKPDDKKLPDVPLLYDDYVQYGLIGEKERDGGFTAYLKAGLVFDTRDQEAAPTKGVWSEVILLGAPSFFGNREYSFAKIAAIHRQYINLSKKKLILGYRLAYQGTIGGTAPFYIQPYMYSSYSLTTRPDGLGGAKTLRGILRNRIVGDGIIYGNLELRWKFLKGKFLKQNYYIGITGFADAGMVVQEHPVDEGKIPFMQAERALYFDQYNDSMHMSFGAGFRLGLNENFVVAIDFGIAPDKRDGNTGLYFTVGNLF